MGEKEASQALEREKNGGMVEGRIPATTVCKVNTKQYQLSGSDLRVVPTTCPDEKYSWLGNVSSGTKLQISDQHAVKMDSAVR